MEKQSKHPVAVYRAENKYTQSQLASLLDVSEQTIRRLEQGTLPVTDDYYPGLPAEVILQARVWTRTVRHNSARKIDIVPQDSPAHYHPLYVIMKLYDLSVNAAAKAWCVSPRLITDYLNTHTQQIPRELNIAWHDGYEDSEINQYLSRMTRYLTFLESVD